MSSGSVPPIINVDVILNDGIVVEPVQLIPPIVVTPGFITSSTGALLDISPPIVEVVTTPALSTIVTAPTEVNLVQVIPQLVSTSYGGVLDSPLVIVVDTDVVHYSVSSSHATLAELANYAVSATYAISSSLAELSQRSITASYAIAAGSSAGLFESASFSITSSYATSASYAPPVDFHTGSYTGSFSGSFYGSGSGLTGIVSSSYAISASYASNAGITNFSTGSYTGSFTGSLLGTSSWALSSSFVDPSVFSNVVVPLQYVYVNAITNSDPGKGKFKYNSLTSGSITEIYIDQLTDGGLNIATIINGLKSGSAELYIQQKDDNTRASLFQISGPTIDNTGWFTIPVIHVSSADSGLPQNNKTCALFIVNRTALTDGATYPITASWANNAVSSSYALTASYASNAPAITNKDIYIPLCNNQPAQTVINGIPSILTEHDTTDRIRFDFSTYAQIQLKASVVTSGPINSALSAQFSTDLLIWNDFATNFTCSLTNTGIVVTNWFTLTSSSLTDVFIRWVTLGGDDASNPAIKYLSLGAR